MQKSYVKVDRQRGRVIRIEVDPHLGELLYSVPAPAEVAPAPLTIADEHLGLLIVPPDAPGNPRRTAGPPRWLYLVLALLSMAMVLLVTAGAGHG